MALDSSSTLDEMIAAYQDNASYREDGSVGKARSFVTACRMLLLEIPRRSSHGRSSTDFSPELIRQEMVAAQKYVAANQREGNGVKHLAVRKFRT